MEILKYLEGKKTYISGVILAIYAVFQVFGIITATAEQNMAIIALLGAIMGISLKAGIKRENEAIMGRLGNKE